MSFSGIKILTWMSKRNFLLAIWCVTFSLLGCGKKNLTTDIKKGHFDGWGYLDDENSFSTDFPIEPNDIKKITSGDLKYYAWKTIKKNIITKKEPKTTYSGYETITTEEFSQFGLEGQKYLRTEDRILINYLFFIDCLYNL